MATGEHEREEQRGRKNEQANHSLISVPKKRDSVPVGTIPAPSKRSGRNYAEIRGACQDCPARADAV